MYTKGQRETFSPIKFCIDFIGRLINLLCDWATAVTVGEIFINHTFWKLES